MKCRFFFFIFVLISTAGYSLDGSIFFTSDPKYEEKWYRSVSEEPYLVPNYTQFVPEQLFYINFYFWDYFVSPTGEVDVTYSVSITSPQDKTVFSRNRMVAAKKKVDGLNLVLIANTYNSLKLSKNYPFGEYKVKIEIQDNLIKKTKVIEGRFQYLQNHRPNAFRPSGDCTQLDRFIENYPSNPNPNAVPAALDCLAQKLEQIPIGKQFVYLTFFSEIIRIYPHLIAILKQEYLSSSISKKNIISFLMSDLKSEWELFSKGIPEGEKAEFQYFQSQFHIYKVPQDTFYSSHDVDIAYAQFCANSDFGRIVQFVLLLNQKKNSSLINQELYYYARSKLTQMYQNKGIGYQYLVYITTMPNTGLFIQMELKSILGLK